MRDIAANLQPRASEVAYSTPRPLTIHSLFPVGAFYFFLNGAGLPLGLFFTTLLAPLLYIWLYLKGFRWITVLFLLALAPFVIAHYIIGIGSQAYYIRSAVLMWTVYVAVYGIIVALLRARHLERLFNELIIANFWATIVAIVMVPTPLREFLWQSDANAPSGTAHYLRLKLLTSEPAVYASLMMPLVVFATLRLMQVPGKRNWLFAAMIGIPFLLCQSFGGVGMFVIGIGLASLITFRRSIRRSKGILVAVTAAILLATLLVIPNPISQRLGQVIGGQDSSADSRTVLSFVLAYAVAAPKSLLWGAGLGQTKLIDVSSLGIGFVKAVIPNAIAGIFAELGIIGVVVKFGIEIFLFFRMRVLGNSFRLAMFVIAFMFQLGGGYLANVQEYLLWGFAFAPLFPQMDVPAESD